MASFILKGLVTNVCYTALCDPPNRSSNPMLHCNSFYCHHFKYLLQYIQKTRVQTEKYYVHVHAMLRIRSANTIITNILYRALDNKPNWHLKFVSVYYLSRCHCHCLKIMVAKRVKSMGEVNKMHFHVIHPHALKRRHFHPLLS